MKLKSAFTLAEVMIFLIIVSTLLTIIFVSLKPKKIISDKNVKYKYAAVYDALNLATYDLMYKDETNPFEQIDSDPNKGFKKLCNGLADYINTESVNCSTPLSNSVAFMKNEDTDFRDIKPNLTSLTGVNFYISKMIIDDKAPNDTRSYYDPENPNFTLQFYMVYADINGKDMQNRPHTILYKSEEKNPDIFAFAIIPTGEAIPMGIAEYNIKYLATRVSYKDNKSVYYSPYYSYREAKHAAWNWYNVTNPTTKFKDRISFTYNDYIREILNRNNTKLYNFNTTNEFPNTYNTSVFPKCVPQAGTLLTYYDMCGITVDTPNFGATQ